MSVGLLRPGNFTVFAVASSVPGSSSVVAAASAVESFLAALATAFSTRVELARLPDFQKERNNERTNARNDDCVIPRNTSSGLNGLGSRAIPAFAVPSTGRGTAKAGDMTMADLAESFRMLDTFASAGATHFDRNLRCLPFDGGVTLATNGEGRIERDGVMRHHAIKEMPQRREMLITCGDSRVVLHFLEVFADLPGSDLPQLPRRVSRSRREIALPRADRHGVCAHCESCLRRTPALRTRRCCPRDG